MSDSDEVFGLSDEDDGSDGYGSDLPSKKKVSAIQHSLGQLGQGDIMP